jgi:hypothetical protein
VPSQKARTLKMGLYRHYKGQLYQVLGLAHDANSPERTCVVYFGLQLDGAHLGPRLAVRNLESGDDPFFDWVVSPDGTSPAVPRFDYLGPELTQEMLDTLRN